MKLDKEKNNFMKLYFFGLRVPSKRASTSANNPTSESKNKLNRKQKLDTMERRESERQKKEGKKTMGQSKAQAKATNNYRKSHYEQFNLQLPKGTKSKLSDYAQAHNYKSLTALICYLLEKETGISCKLENGLAWLKK